MPPTLTEKDFRTTPSKASAQLPEPGVQLYKKAFFIALFMFSKAYGAQASDWKTIEQMITQQEEHFVEDFFREKGIGKNEWVLQLTIQPPSQWAKRECHSPQVVPPRQQWQLGSGYYALICTEESWRGKVRVNRSAQVPVITLANHGTRHQLIQESDLRRQQRTLNRRNANALFSKTKAVGYQLKHRLPMGHVLQHSDLMPPYLVTKHQAVTIIASGSGFQIKMSGKALKSGQKGDWITVQNSRSGKRLRAQIVAKHTVLLESQR